MTEGEAARRYIVPKLEGRLPGIYLTKVVGTAFKKGQPDYFFVCGGIGGVIEVKLWDNVVPTSLQLKNIIDADKAGGVGMLVIIKQDRTLLCKIVRESTTATRIAWALAADVELL